MKFSVNVKPDIEGYTGRECPECEKYFKIMFGTGFEGDSGCHCPYCRHHGSHDTFWTKDQVKFAHSVVVNKVSGDLLRHAKRLERKPNRNQLISIGVTVKGQATPIARYSEKELEEKIECDHCTLKYTIYGSFGCCPDCGIYNSKQIVAANFDLVMRILELAQHTDLDIQHKLIENALEDCISVFDGFAREHCATACANTSFQNIKGAHSKLLTKLGVDITESISEEEWNFTVMQFQKRHLLAHKLGLIDEEYIKKTGISSLQLGRKVPITEDDVKTLVNHLTNISETISLKITHDL